MGTVELSKRLISVAKMVTPGNRLCDVGCDHGFLSIYLVENKTVPQAIASDVRPGPLSAAKEHVAMSGLTSIIETRLSDGLKSINAYEADSLVIAGMGGPLILKILSAKPEVRDSFKEIIIEPQSQIPEVRQGLDEQSLIAVDEDFVLDEGKFYPVIKLVPAHFCGEEVSVESKKRMGRLLDRLAKLEISDEPLYAGAAKTDDKAFILEEITSRYGSIIIDKKNSVFADFLTYENGILQEILSNLDEDKHFERIKEVKRQIYINQLAKEMCV